MAATSPLPPLSAERTGPNAYLARNDRGAQVRIGPPGAADSFTPGELLQAAIAGCSALSAEAQLAHHLGEDFEATATTDGTHRAEDNRIAALGTSILADMSTLDDAQRARLITSAERFIERLCTVKRTIAHGADLTVQVEAR